MQGATAAWLDGGRRLHLHHGPIDLVVEAWGAPEEVRPAYAAAAKRFAAVLEELCAELALLRLPAGSGTPRGPVARRMAQAVRPYRDRMFITPMAAVAGAVAEEILGAMTGTANLDKAFVNNGGDIALHLTAEASFEIGLGDLDNPGRLAGTAQVEARSAVRGIATSGWGGRSFSLGIADSVTVLAASASVADAAATAIANAVDLPGNAAITRAPAASLQPDSDLGPRLVTVAVGPLLPSEIETALNRGRQAAEALVAGRRIHAAALFLRGYSEIVGEIDLNPAPIARPRTADRGNGWKGRDG